MVILIYAAMLLALWFFIFRPQRKQQEQLRNLRSSLVVGDKIVTIGGIIGIITQLGDDEVSINSGESSSLVFKRTAIASRISEQVPQVEEQLDNEVEGPEVIK